MRPADDKERPAGSEPLVRVYTKGPEPTMERTPTAPGKPAVKIIDELSNTNAEGAMTTTAMVTVTVVEPMELVAVTV